ARADRRPVAEGDLPEIAAARHSPGARVLLGPVHAVGERVVRDHVVELRRGLVEPAAPAAPAVERDHRALVAAHDHAGSAPGIGRASCRERVCLVVSISVVAVSLKKKTTITIYSLTSLHYPQGKDPPPQLR